MFSWIAASGADAAAVYPSSIKTLLANGLSTFFIKDNTVLSNGPKSLHGNPLFDFLYATDILITLY